MARNRRQQAAFDTLEQRFWSLVSRAADDACWPWTGRTDNNGYGRFRGAKNLGSQLAHRNAWEFFHKASIPEGMHLLHRCDNPPCCNPAHLRVGTHQENMADRNRKCRQARLRGSQCGAAKLTLAQVSEIRDRLARGEAAPSIGRAFSVSRDAIYSIKKGRTWSHEDRSPG